MTHTVESTKEALGITDTPPPSPIDLSGYFTKEEVTALITQATGADLSAYYTKTQTDIIAATKLAVADVVDSLASTETAKPLSAAQGKVLKILIDNLTTLLNSDNVNLDTLQEIVDFIELNKATLDTLGITNIAGLQNALNAKAEATHTHSELHTHANKSFLDTITTLSTVNGQDIRSGGDIVFMSGAEVITIGVEYIVPQVVDGKQVYGLRFNFGALPNATTKDIAIPNYNASYTYWQDTANCKAFDASKNSITLPYANPTSLNNNVSLAIVTNQIARVITVANWSSYNAYITVHYTK